MSNDARISTTLPDHPKTKKLIRRLGEGAAWRLVCLFLWAAANRPSGDLSGMTAEDIELAVNWTGEPDAFVRELAQVGFFEGEEGAYRIHDWADHNPWVNGAQLRSAKAKWNAIKRHHGEQEADRQVPEWACVRSADSTENDAGSKKKGADSKKAPKSGSDGTEGSAGENPAETAENGNTDASSNGNEATSNADSNAPSPSPYPSPEDQEQERRARAKNDDQGSWATPTAAATACMAMRKGGLAITNPAHPLLLAALDEGATPAMWLHTATEACEHDPPKGFAWVIAAVRGRLADAAAATAITGANHATSPHRSESGLADQVHIPDDGFGIGFGGFRIEDAIDGVAVSDPRS